MHQQLTVKLLRVHEPYSTHKLKYDKSNIICQKSLLNHFSLATDKNCYSTEHLPRGMYSYIQQIIGNGVVHNDYIVMQVDQVGVQTCNYKGCIIAFA